MGPQVHAKFQRNRPSRQRWKKNSKAVADAGESCLTTEKGLYSSLSLSDNAYSDLPMAHLHFTHGSRGTTMSME